MTTAPPKRPPAPPPPKPAVAGQARERRSFNISSGIAQTSHKVVIYGPGGVGKTELCCLLQRVGIKPLIVDVEMGSGFIDVHRVGDITEWQDLRDLLHSDNELSAFDAIVIDSLTKAEELAVAWTLANVPHEKGHMINSVEGYGFGKGMTYVYETFLVLLGDLDAIHRRGKHVVCVAHECVSNVPNPAGEDWIRYEPRLQSPASGKASIRHRVKEWCDHLLYVGYDQSVNRDGKAVGSGTRTIYPTETPTHWAKSRYLSDPIPYEKDSPQLWQKLFTGRTS